MNDLRGCLQDFLAYVQQLLIEKDKPSKWIKKARFYLLDYRYFFVHYFDQMETTKINRQSFGNKFNFVEEYLEAAEDVLN